MFPTSTAALGAGATGVASVAQALRGRAGRPEILPAEHGMGASRTA